MTVLMKLSNATQPPGAVFDIAGVDAFLTRKYLFSDETVNPSAAVYSRDNSELYIADNNRIWAMSVANGSLRLLASSNFVPELKGTGPDLGSRMTSLVLDPQDEVLYASAGDLGIIAIDIATGNRVVVSK
jgi:hypothetical protein